MSRKRRSPPGEPKTEALNMTPMIDVVFQLLIFFMLSMNFKEAEGKLLATLPRHGTAALPESNPLLQEVRVVLCAGDSADEHLTDKARHLKTVRNAALTRLLVERMAIGELRPTATTPAAAAGNKALLREAAARVQALVAGLPADPLGRTPPVILDADPEVPYEHVLGLVNACREKGLEKVEFVADPRRTPK